MQYKYKLNQQLIKTVTKQIQSISKYLKNIQKNRSRNMAAL